MGGEAILVVDDAEANRTLTDIVLTDDGFDVHTAAAGGEALALLRGFHPDLMLVDIRMPGMDGLELTRRVKQSERTRDIVVVALTACAAEGDQQKAAAAGCDGYITKPIDTRRLGDQVRKYLAQRTSGSQTESIPAGGTPASGRGVEALRRRFLEEGILQSRQMLECLNQQFDVANASGLLHRWVGGGNSRLYEHFRVGASRSRIAQRTGARYRTAPYCVDRPWIRLFRTSRGWTSSVA